VTIHVPAWVDGRLTPVEKIEAHRRGLRHKAISVFLVSGDAVLLQKRAADKYHTPGLWANACCTHPTWGETAMACAHRRLHEELGVSGLTLTPRGTVEYRTSVGNDLIEHEVVALFVGEIPRAHPIRPEPSEVAETRWMTLHDLVRDARENSDIYTPWLRIYLEKHHDAIFGAILGG